MMRVRFFGRLSGLEAAGPLSPMDSDAFRERLATRLPELADARVRMVVNDRLVTSRMQLSPDDEIAFLPPTSGG